MELKLEKQDDTKKRVRT